jgi:putative protease
MGVQRVTLSPELNIKEIKEITKNTTVPTEVIAYGRLPVMVMENCVIKSQGMCSRTGGCFDLSDRMGERFPIMCENCRNILLNSVPLYMADKWSDLLSLNVDVIRLKFTTETPDEVKKVICAYKEGLSGKTPKGVFDRITRGHFYRGAE